MKSGIYTNKIRYSNMIKLFQGSGFTIVKSRLDRWRAFSISRKKLAPGFQSLSNDDLLIKSYDILLGSNSKILPSAL